MYIRMLLIAITFLIFPVGISNLYALPWCGCGNCMMMYANPPKMYLCIPILLVSGRPQGIAAPSLTAQPLCREQLYSRKSDSHDHSISFYGRECVPNERQ